MLTRLTLRGRIENKGHPTGALTRAHSRRVPYSFSHHHVPTSLTCSRHHGNRNSHPDSV